MRTSELLAEHKVLYDILSTRGFSEFPDGMALWKFKITDAEYADLKETLRKHQDVLYRYGMEAALGYAEWWRRDYHGYIPSKEDVAEGMGLPREYSSILFDAAKDALRRYKYAFLHSFQRTEYFRTLLNQGGLPVAYIKKHGGGLGSFTRFLSRLVRELSAFDYDWEHGDNSIIRQFDCISYLGQTFRNENIYDVAFQIAHAIITDDNSLLPYDDSDESLAELTVSLKKDYSSLRRELRPRPLSLHWKLCTNDNGTGCLYVSMEPERIISSTSIDNLDASTCSRFDVLVEGTLVGQYVRKSIEGGEGKVRAIYTRLPSPVKEDILWKGEPVVEVKFRCDNDQCICQTIMGSYPPDFETPQVFQMLEEHLYVKKETVNSESNIAIATKEWRGIGASHITILGGEYALYSFANEISLHNDLTDEKVTLTNQFSPYAAEFSGNYITWVEESNYKLSSGMSAIRVYDKEKNRVNKFKTYYRLRASDNAGWNVFNTSHRLPIGLIDIKVVFPDGHSCVEKFYNIGSFHFTSRNEAPFSTEIVCLADSSMDVEMEHHEQADIDVLGNNAWRIRRKSGSKVCPSTCSFRIYSAGNRVLRLSIAIPFNGVMITDVEGKIVPNGEIISFDNLAHYHIISHGHKKRELKISYCSGCVEESSERIMLKSKVEEGLKSLVDYQDKIDRIFHIYGSNCFDRSSSVSLSIFDTTIHIRRFVLESEMEGDKIIIREATGSDTAAFHYEGSLYVVPVEEGIDSNEFYPVALFRNEENPNEFSFPQDYLHREVIVFSGAEAKCRIVPKYYHRAEAEVGPMLRAIHSKQVTESLYEQLVKEDVCTGRSWKILCRAFSVCSQYHLPFTTYNGFKAVGRNPALLVKFILAMWMNDEKNAIIRDIDSFESEMVTSFHWIPASVWQEQLQDMMENAPDILITSLQERMPALFLFLQEIFSITLSAEVAVPLSRYISGGEIEAGKAFTKPEMNEYRMKIRGLDEVNADLPRTHFFLAKDYYPHLQMLAFQRTMFDSAMCAAENTANLDDRTDLFACSMIEKARIANFYRRYFRLTYSEIFFRALQLIVHPKTQE